MLRGKVILKALAFRLAQKRDLSPFLPAKSRTPVGGLNKDCIYFAKNGNLEANSPSILPIVCKLLEDLIKKESWPALAEVQ